MKYKDAVSYQCKCGRELVVPFPSMQRTKTLAPSERELKQASYALSQEIIFHQNKQCPWMDEQRKKATLATKPESVVIPSGAKLI